MDQTRLDRLVDDELTQDQRRELIGQLADDPDGWRQCALAFLEAQSLRAHLAAWSDTSHASRTGTNQEGWEQAVVVSPLAPARRTRSRLDGNQRGSAWFTLAACVLVAFGLGRYAAIWPESTGPQVQPPGETSAPDGTLWKGATVQGYPKIVAYQPDVDMFAGESAVPHDVEQQLRQRGFDIQRRKGLMSAVDAGGNPILLPFEDVNVVPVGLQFR